MCRFRPAFPAERKIYINQKTARKEGQTPRPDRRGFCAPCYVLRRANFNSRPHDAVRTWGASRIHDPDEGFAARRGRLFCVCGRGMAAKPRLLKGGAAFCAARIRAGAGECGEYDYSNNGTVFGGFPRCGLPCFRLRAGRESALPGAPKARPFGFCGKGVAQKS